MTRNIFSTSSSLYRVGLLALGILHAPMAMANPSGAAIVKGKAHINASGKKLNIHQQSDKAVIDWRSFDIEVDEHTQFYQPNAHSMTLNRVNSNDPSRILGKLTANGNLVLVNPNGVFFGSSATVDVNSIIATTSDIDNADFMNDKLVFDKPGNPNAAIINQGTITAKEAGLVGLVAPNVINHGVITAKLGRVELASGDGFFIDLYGDGLYQLKVSDAVASQLIQNTGTLDAAGGTIAITAAAAGEIVNSLVHIEGELHTPTIEQEGGVIRIMAEGSNAVAGNQADLKGKKQGNSNVTIQNATLNASGTEDYEQGGQIEILGDHITMNNATLDASGHTAPSPIIKPILLDTESATLDLNREVRSEEAFLTHENRAGGSIKIGGDYLGGGDTSTAKSVSIAENVQIRNDATHSGDAGRTIIWSDDRTEVAAQFSAQAVEGHGGFVETSGKVKLTIDDTVRVNTSSILGNNGLWLLDPQDFTIAATGGDMSGATLTTNLATGDVAILSSSGGTAGSGDINVNDTVSWSNNTLTLTAARNINVNDVMTATGTAALTMNTATANGADGSVAGGNILMDLDGSGFNGRIDYSAAGAVTINGDVYTVITSLGAAGSVTGTDLQGIEGALAGDYVLGANIDASATTGWNGGDGFDAIGDGGSNFTGNFNGFGHTVSNLYIDRPVEDIIGLFAYTNGADIRNIGMLNVDITAHGIVGGLAGYNTNSSVSNSYTTGNISTNFNFTGGLIGINLTSTVINSYATANVSSIDSIGGLIGANAASSVSNSYATGDVSANSQSGGLIGANAASSVSNSYATGDVSANSQSGGLIGYNTNASTTNSYATGEVSGTSFAIGGLIGYNANASTTNSYATGDVSGVSQVGGLIGLNAASSSVSNSYATGNVTNTNDNTGGLVGANAASSTITNSYATGTVDGIDDVGGLVGENNDSSIATSYATGTVSSTGDNIGGLVGFQASSASVTNSYATSSVSSTGDDVGGLVGENDGTSSIITSYSIGSATAAGDAGGLIANNIGTITDSFWNTVTSGNATSDGGTGLTTAQMQDATSFSGVGWDISTTGGSAAAWRIYDGDTFPLLRNFLTDLTITIDDVTKKYDGNIFTTGDASSSASGFKTGESLVDLSGTFAYSGTAIGAKDAGSYTISAGGYYSNQQGYDIEIVDATLTITPLVTDLDTFNPSNDQITTTVTTVIADNDSLTEPTLEDINTETEVESTVTITTDTADLTPETILRDSIDVNRITCSKLQCPRDLDKKTGNNKVKPIMLSLDSYINIEEPLVTFAPQEETPPVIDNNSVPSKKTKSDDSIGN